MSEWISVEDRLPTSGKPVLVYTNFGEIYTCRVSVMLAKNNREKPKYGVAEKFTHWALLPEPP